MHKITSQRPFSEPHPAEAETHQETHTDEQLTLEEEELLKTENSRISKNGYSSSSSSGGVSSSRSCRLLNERIKEQPESPETAVLLSDKRKWTQEGPFEFFV